MKLKKVIINAGAVLAILILAYILSLLLIRVEPPGFPSGARIGEVINTSIQTPHPYPNSAPEEELVWSAKIEHPGSTFIRIHYNKLEIIGREVSPTTYVEVDYGDCNLTAPPGWVYEWDGKNTINMRQIIEEGVGGIGGIGVMLCGIVTEQKKYTPQEIFDNHQSWVWGDFLAVRNSDGTVIDIILGNSSAPYWGSDWTKTYWDTDAVTLELYADELDNAYGVYIDKYSRGFSEEERAERDLTSTAK